MRRPTDMPTLLAVLAALLLVTASAPGQTSRPDRDDGAEASETPRGLLAGPKVDETEKGSGASFLEPRRGRSARGGGAARRWLRLVGGLDLVEEQRAAVRAEIAALTRERRAFQREYGAELRSLQNEIREARQSERDVPREQVARLQELRAMGPRVDAAQERIWALLTSEQRTELREALARPRSGRGAPRDGDAMTPPRGDADGPEAGLDEMSRRRLRFLLERRERP